MPLTAISGTLGKKKAAHLLRRATFGPTKQNIDDFAGKSITEAMSSLFQTLEEPLPPIDPVTKITWIGTPVLTGSTAPKDSDRQDYFKAWWIKQMLSIDVDATKSLAWSAREKVVFFIHTIFTTIQTTVNSSRALYYQNVLFRKFAFDGALGTQFNFKELTKKICVDNAMLTVLDGRLNVKGSVNENFARELLELYSIGKGREDKKPTDEELGERDYYYFTEEDVRAAAYVLSGFDTDPDFKIIVTGSQTTENPAGTYIDPDTLLPRGKVKSNGTQHEPGEKIFSNRFGNAVVTQKTELLLNGRPSEASMLDEISQLVDIIYSREETAFHICRRIYRFYVYHTIDDTVYSDIISSMVSTFKSNNYKIEPVIKELLSSQHFFDSSDADINNDNYGALIKSPLDLALGTLRFFGHTFPNYSNNTQDYYDIIKSLLGKLSEQGMDFLNPSSVAGYEAYYQYPLFNQFWISTNALTNRYNLIKVFMTQKGATETGITLDSLKLIKDNFDSKALDPEVLLKEIISYIFTYYQETDELTVKRLNYFFARFLDEDAGSTKAEKVDKWTSYYFATDKYEDAKGFTNKLFNAILQSPEYQLF